MSVLLGLFSGRTSELMSPELFKAGDVFEQITSESGLRVLRPGVMGHSSLLTDFKLEIPKDHPALEATLGKVARNLHSAVGATIAHDRRLEVASVLQGLEISVVMPGSPDKKIFTQLNKGGEFNAEHWRVADQASGSNVEAQVLVNLNLN